MTQVGVPATGTLLGPPGSAKLITRQRSAEEHIDNGRGMDVRGALQRGLAEYLQALRLDAEGGREIRFKAVFDAWAEPEENAVYPSAAVLPAGGGTYEDRGLTPAINPNQRLKPPDGRYLVIPSEYAQDIQVECWCTDPVERSNVALMCERGFNPVHWRTGFVLELPYYYNVRATYMLRSQTIPDDPDDAQRRYRRVIFTVRAQAPLVVLFSFPDMKPVFRLDAVGEDVEV